ncbi:hypothetical protein F4814DRAFT_456066 [Daldinia grandis]|nr:hypothetical protein F4814DRAFT_456066 [Daldinia grandis]
MASFGNRGGASSPSPAIDSRHDPFVVPASPPSAGRHRLSTFDSQLFSLSPNASPTQAKRALEAHLAETDRRMEEAGKLGTALLQQRKELSQRLMEVEKQKAEGELSDDLRQRLAEIEKDYNDVAKESARAFLPKQRIPSNEAAAAAAAAAGSPFAPESKGGRRSVSPSNKFSVPNRKARNQPTNRIHDIEFAAEISLLAEKEEELKEIRVEKSKLEYEAEGFQQRVKTLDESEHRYKDENWSLETQVHDLLAKEREAEDRYKKLQQTLTVLQAEKNSTQKELDEEYAAAVKHHDIELGSAKRNIVIADAERVALRRRIDELTGQNQELAKAVSASQRARVIERESILGMNQEDSESAQDKTTPEHSPPPSPVKGTPRHSLLESETLKTSLGHAHRTIQGLRSNVHREKTEKLELRRMLQEARDELEKLRNEPPPPPKRTRKAEVKEQRKPLRLLGGLRTVRSEVFSEDSNWEDQPDSTSPAASTLASRSSRFESVAEEPGEQFETANETSDAAFETAHEPATETDDFHTGAEEFSSDDDAETETESPSRRRTPRNSISGFQGRPRSGSMHSTASTEDEDFPFGYDAGAPVALPPLQAKFPLRVSRGAYRRSRQPSEEPAFPSSPPSVAGSSVAGTPQQPIKNLAAELGEFDGSDNESYLSATPSRRSIRGRTVSPPPPVPSLPRAIMIDSKLEVLKSNHAKEINEAITETNAAHSRELEVLKSSHIDEINKAVSRTQNIHSRELEMLKSSHAEEISRALTDLKHETAESQKLRELADAHSQMLENKLQELANTHLHELENLRQTTLAEVHGDAQSQKLKDDSEKSKALAALAAAHAVELEALRHENRATRHQSILSNALETLQGDHANELEQLKKQHDAAQAEALEALRASYSLEELATLNADHAATLELYQNDNAAEKEKLLADHAAELEALRIALQITPPTLVSELRSPKRDAFIIPHEDRSAHASSGTTGLGLLGRRDDTQSKGPFKEPAVDISSQGYVSPDSYTITTSRAEARQRVDRPASAQASASPRLSLPLSHREAIEAAPLPARRPLSPSSIVKGTPTPKAGRSSTPGYADVHSSSVSSFASEIDTRFNIRGEMGMDASAFGPSTDPRMIQAITQTMIGEYLWKYTRKTGRGEMSDNRHRRYFWVHPYTRTLYWSDRDPIPIEAVRIVGDDNPMPPGLHRKSLIIVSPGRTTWFNALSQADAEDVAGQITQEDVDEFNPPINRRPANGATRAGSPRVEVSMSIPTLTPTREREASRSSTLGRLSGYWKSSSMNSTEIIEEQDQASDRLENVRACCDGKHDVGTLVHTKRGRIHTSHSQTHSHTHPGPSTTPTSGSTSVRDSRATT